MYLSVCVIGGENFVLCIENSGFAQIEYSECHAKEKLHDNAQHDCSLNKEHNHHDCFDIDLDVQALDLLTASSLKVHLKNNSLSHFTVTSISKNERLQPLPLYISNIPPPYIKSLKTTLLLI